MDQQDTPHHQAHAFIRTKLANAVLITSLGITGGVSAQEVNTGDPVQEIIIKREKNHTLSAGNHYQPVPAFSIVTRYPAPGRFRINLTF